jgi:hypothetical protein
MIDSAPQSALLTPVIHHRRVNLPNGSLTLNLFLLELRPTGAFPGLRAEDDEVSGEGGDAQQRGNAKHCQHASLDSLQA